MLGRIVLLVCMVLAGLVATARGAGSVDATSVVTHSNLTYCHSQTLDLYVPRATGQGQRPLPLAIYVHGGGMTSGDKSDLNPVFRDVLTSNGYAVASIDYRLAPQFRFPAQIEDVKCAIRYLRAKAPKYGLNANQVFAFGTSVGGELVALAALTGPHSAFDAGPYRTEPSTLSAVADMFGPATLMQTASGFTSSDLQQVFGNDHREVVLASPTHYVVPDAPPILLVQGVDDSKVLKSQSITLYRDLKAAGDQSKLVLVQNMGHMFVQVGAKPLDPSVRQIAADMVQFFDHVRNP